MIEHSFNYDLAFSFLTADQDAATKLHRLLTPALTSFLYTEQQKTLAGADGYAKFAAVFAEQARMVIVCYRDGWGESGFTHIECTAIKRRIHREGSGFLFIVVADTEPRPKVPDWLPGDHVYWDLPAFGFDDAAEAIRQRVRRVGGLPKIETAAAMAVRIKRESQAASARKWFRQADGQATAKAEMRVLFSALADIAAASQGVFPEPIWNNVQTAITFAPVEGRPKLTLALQTAALRSERGPDLHVKLWRDNFVPSVPTPGMQSSPLYTSDYQIDRDDAGIVGWRPMRSAEHVTLSSYEVAEREVKELLTRRGLRR